VAVGAPANVGALADHAREDGGGGLGVSGKGGELGLVGVSDAEAADDQLFVDPVDQGPLGVRRGGGDVLLEEERAVLG
jgi:hypothetical protein